MIEAPYIHTAKIVDDGLIGGGCRFHWHFQRGLLKPRMSGLELAEFVMGHMPAILGMGLLRDNPQVESEFKALMVRIALTPKEAIDEILPWIRTVYHGEEDDVIHMSLFDRTPQPEGRRYFL